jgi:hypothetical protein
MQETRMTQAKETRIVNDAVIPAYLGWSNPKRDNSSLRLYATDEDNPRWSQEHQGGRVVEYAAVERFGQVEGDRFPRRACR